MASPGRNRISEARGRDGGAKEVETVSGRLRDRHFRIGWWWLILFTAFGLVLEGLHAFKAPWYLRPSTEARRLMFTLAHAHGTLLGLVNLAMAGTWHLGRARTPPREGLASSSVIIGSVLVPLGFLLGGFFISGGDPGLGTLLVPPGSLLLLPGLILFFHRGRPRQV